MNHYRLADITLGMKASFEKKITVEMEDAFRKISGDENPLHRNDDFAMQISEGKYRKHVSFGMLIAALYSTIAGMYLPGENSLIHSMEELSFLKPVFAGDTLIVEGEVVDKQEEIRLIRLKVTIRNQNNQLVSRAKMKVLVMK